MVKKKCHPSLVFINIHLKELKGLGQDFSSKFKFSQIIRYIGQHTRISGQND